MNSLTVAFLIHRLCDIPFLCSSNSFPLLWLSMLWFVAKKIAHCTERLVHVRRKPKGHFRLVFGNCKGCLAYSKNAHWLCYKYLHKYIVRSHLRQILVYEPELSHTTYAGHQRSAVLPELLLQFKQVLA